MRTMDLAAMIEVVIALATLGNFIVILQVKLAITGQEVTAAKQQLEISGELNKIRLTAEHNRLEVAEGLSKMRSENLDQTHRLENFVRDNFVPRSLCTECRYPDPHESGGHD